MKRKPLAIFIGLVLGLISLIFGAVAGVPAILFSYYGLYIVNRSDGVLTGARWAVAGMILGCVGTLITTVGIAAVLILRLEATSNRAGCQNHFRLVGLGLLEYADTYEHFPAATRDPIGLEPARRLSWMTEILPLLGEGTKANASYRELAGRLDRSAAWDAPANAAIGAVPVRPFLCPAHPQYSPHKSPGFTHFVGLSGDGADAAHLKRQDGRAGVFGHDRGIARREAQAGISNTLTVAETTDENGPWIAGDQPTVRGIPNTNWVIGPGRPFGGLHRGFMHALWLDGSVRPMNEETPGELVRRMARLHARE